MTHVDNSLLGAEAADLVPRVAKLVGDLIRRAFAFMQQEHESPPVCALVIEFTGHIDCMVVPEDLASNSNGTGSVAASFAMGLARSALKLPGVLAAGALMDAYTVQRGEDTLTPDGGSLANEPDCQEALVVALLLRGQGEQVDRLLVTLPYTRSADGSLESGDLEVQSTRASATIDGRLFTEPRTASN